MSRRRTLREAIALAQAATRTAGLEAVDPAGWDAAIEAWAEVVPHLPGDLDPDSVALALDFAARTRLSRAWAGGPEHDLEAAVDLWRRATRVMTPGFADRAAIWNNLGVALRDLADGGAASLLDEAVAAGQAAVGASATNAPVGISARVQLGKALRLRYERRRRGDDLDAAIAALDEAARAADVSDDGARAESHEALGNALYARFELDGADADQHASVENLRIALDLLPADDVDVVTYSSNLAAALLGRFELIDGHRAELDEAVALLDVALKAAGGKEAASGELLSNVGNGLRLRAVADGSVDEVDRAVGLLARAVEVEVESARRAGLLGNLAGGLLERYDLTGRIADVDEAIAALDESLSLPPADDANRPSRLNNLGIALRTRALRRHEAGREDLDRAVAAFEDALALTPAQAPDAAALHANLGNVLHQRHDVTRDPEDIGRAVRELEAALERTPEGSADRPGYLNNLAATLSARAAEPHGAGGDLDRAVGAASEAVRLCPPESARRATFLVNLGNTLAERYDRSRALDDLFAAREAYRAAAETGLAAGPADAFAAARNWSEWARDRRDWEEVADAYTYGEQATGALLRAQLLRADKESWLRDVEGLVTDGAFALVACSRAREAAVALERGRALLLSEALEREQADLSRLLEGNRTELAARFRRSAARVRSLELSAPRGSPRRSGVSIAATSGRPP